MIFINDQPPRCITKIRLTLYHRRSSFEQASANMVGGIDAVLQGLHVGWRTNKGLSHTLLLSIMKYNSLAVNRAGTGAY